MGIGAGVVIAAIGAILRFGVTTHNNSSVNIHTIGVIVLIAGIIIALADAAVFMPRRRRTTTSTTYVDPNDPMGRGPNRTTYTDDRY